MTIALMQWDLQKLSSYCGPCWGGWSVKLFNLCALSDRESVCKDKSREIVQCTKRQAEQVRAQQWWTTRYRTS